MIIDCFPFFNELDLLEIRLHELSEVVDCFVLAEATLTHSGKPKPLYYQENQDRFKDFHEKIRVVTVEDMPMTDQQIQAAITPQDRKWLATGYQLGDDWVRERFQRNALMRGLDGFGDDDLIIIGDADEIVRASVVERFPEIIRDGSNAVEQKLHTCYFNWQCTNMPWWGSKVLKRRFFDNPSEHRFHTPASSYIYDGGWHFNFLGGADAIREKIKSYAHQEFNDPKVLDNINWRLKEMKDVLGRLYEYKLVPLDGHFPKYILENLDRFDQYIYKRDDG